MHVRIRERNLARGNKRDQKLKIDLQDKRTPGPKVIMNPYQEVFKHLQ